MSAGKTYRVLIGGGGTGGHVFPAIAIADALKAELSSCEFLFVGALGKLEMEKVPAAGYRIEGLPVAGFQRRITWKNISFFYKLLLSMMKSRRLVRSFRPDIAVGVGGYASGPIVKAAARKGVPVLIQEQNSYAGVTNRLLARSARSICVAYEKMERYFPAEKIILTGNPVRQHLVDLRVDRAEALKEFQLEQGKLTCLVVGGSLGARTLNHSFIEHIKKLDRPDLQLIWQCGKFYHEEVKAALEQAAMTNIRVLPFISRMDLAYGLADVIVSRSGAISISELCLVGKPVILVPSPNVAEDHQTHNAMALVKKEAAVIVKDSDAGDKLVDRVLSLVNDEKEKKALSDNIKELGIPDAAQRIVEELKIIMRTG